MNQIAGTWNAPMDSSGRDPVVGRTEWGAPIYRSALGHTYWREPKKPGYEKNALKLRDMLAMHGDGPRKPVEYATTQQAPEGVSQPTLGGAMGGIRDMIMSGLSAPRRALEGQPVTNGEVMNTALDWGMMTAPMSAPKGALRAGGMADDAPKGIKAYHGSPHDFDRFSMDKIGTGEGAQAYGHGLYFADSEDVARSYRDALAPGMGDGALRAVGVSDGDLRAMRQFTQSSVDPDVALRDWLGWTGKRETPELRDAFMREWSGRNQGRMYEVNINANPDDFLDWDAPLSEQIGISSRLNAQKSAAQSKIKELEAQRKNLLSQQPVQAETGDEFADLFSGSDWEGWKRVSEIDAQIRELEQNARHAEKLAGVGFEKTRRSDDWIIPTTGADLVEGMGRPENVAATLRDAGIPGIKYYDGASRGAGQGTRNYVVFDENLISILRKYGIGAMVPGAGYMLNDAEYSSVERMQ